MLDSTTLATVVLLASASALLLVAMLYPSALLRWFQRKRYQYEVTFSLYMLTSTEKFIFSTSYPPSVHSDTPSGVKLTQHRLGPFPPTLAPHNRRKPVPARPPHHYCESLVLLLFGE
jgi:hypothetical protein